MPTIAARVSHRIGTNILKVPSVSRMPKHETRSWNKPHDGPVAEPVRVSRKGRVSSWTTAEHIEIIACFALIPKAAKHTPAKYVLRRVSVCRVCPPYRGAGGATHARRRPSLGALLMRRPQPRATGRVVDLTRDPMAPPELVTQAILDGLDETARQMEQKWGVGRLRLLVDDALRAKFDAQKAKLDAAIATDQEIYVRAQAAGMRRAWQVLDRAATEAGAQPLAPEVWECVLPVERRGREHRPHRSRGAPRRP